MKKYFRKSSPYKRFWYHSGNNVSPGYKVGLMYVTKCAIYTIFLMTMKQPKTSVFFYQQTDGENNTECVHMEKACAPRRLRDM